MFGTPAGREGGKEEEEQKEEVVEERDLIKLRHVNKTLFPP